MGYEIRFDDGTPESEGWVFALGSATALVGIREWVNAELPAEACPRLHELMDTGTTKDTLELAAEIRAAMEAKPPPDAVRPILENLLANMGLGDEGETATIEV